MFSRSVEAKLGAGVHKTQSPASHSGLKKWVTTRRLQFQFSSTHVAFEASPNREPGQDTPPSSLPSFARGTLAIEDQLQSICSFHFFIEPTGLSGGVVELVVTCAIG